MSDLRIKLNRPQAKAHRLLGPRTTLALPWGRGCGKSEFIRLTWWELVARWDGVLRQAPDPFTGVRIVHVMPTFKQFVDTYAARIEHALKGRWAFLGGKINHTTWRIDFPGGSYIQVYSAEAAEHSRSTRTDVVTVDESDDIDKETYDAVIIPWMSEPWSLQMRVVGGTPKRGRLGLLYRTHRAGLRKQPGCATVHATYRDAPEFVDPRVVEDARTTFDPAIFAREWECDFDSSEGLVYPMFSEELHVREPDPSIYWREVLFGGDFGWNDPGVFLRVGVAGGGRDTIVHITDEIYERQKTVDWWAAQARGLVENQDNEGARWYCDPSRPDSIKTLQRDGGIRACETNNKLEDGIATVANFMAVRQDEQGNKFSRLYVSPRCVNTIRELGLYRYKKDAHDSESITDDIIDRDNHAMDAMRYPLHSRLGSMFSRRHDAAEETYTSE